MWVTPEQIEQARQYDLLSYLQTYEPDNLKRLGSRTYCTKEHDSLKISNGKWHWFSRHIGGKNALDYLIKVKGVSFPEAVALLTNTPPVTITPTAEIRKAPHEFEMPALHSDIQRVKRYLMGRGIDGRLIEYCHKHGMLFEDSKYHNCVFIGRDENGKPKYGALRSTTTDFKLDITGSDKRYPFCLAPSDDVDTLHAFEGVIDLLSYVTLAIKRHAEWHRDVYLSLAGVYETENKQDIPLALSYLGQHPNIRTVCLHFDNDAIGRKAATRLAEALKDKYEVLDLPPKSGKDYNDYLQNEIRKQKETVR